MFKISSFKIKDSKGFTLIELLVIIAIISFISGITLINQKRPENSIKLTLEARKIAMEMRKAQNYALSSVYNCGPGGTAVIPYGVVFNLNSNSQYFLVADCNGDKIYNSGDQIMETLVLNKVFVSNFTPQTGNGTLEVFFFPPIPGVAINTDTGDSATAVVTLCGLTEISLCRRVTVNVRGAISVTQ